MLALATGNRHKLEELTRQIGIDLLPPDRFGLVMDVEETGTTFEANAKLKADWLSAHSHIPALADDSGIVVDALGGEPGVYSARYGGDGKSDRDRRLLLLHNMEGKQIRTARFVCVLCLSFPEGESFFFRGECEGTITFAEQGEGGFGYDPVFLDPESGLTFAELDSAAKDRVSHRGKAIRKLIAWLEDGGRERVGSYSIPA